MSRSISGWSKYNPRLSSTFNTLHLRKEMYSSTDTKDGAEVLWSLNLNCASLKHYGAMSEFRRDPEGDESTVKILKVLYYLALSPMFRPCTHNWHGEQTARKERNTLNVRESRLPWSAPGIIPRGWKCRRSSPPMLYCSIAHSEAWFMHCMVWFASHW